MKVIIAFLSSTLLSIIYIFVPYGADFVMGFISFFVIYTYIKIMFPENYE